jgi:hypothetical protein
MKGKETYSSFTSQTAEIMATCMESGKVTSVWVHVYMHAHIGKTHGIYWVWNAL